MQYDFQTKIALVGSASGIFGNFHSASRDNGKGSLVEEELKNVRINIKGKRAAALVMICLFGIVCGVVVFNSNLGTLKDREDAILGKYKANRKELMTIVEMLKNDHEGVPSVVIGQELFVTNDAPEFEGRIDDYRRLMRRAGVDMITSEAEASGLFVSFIFAESYSLDGQTIGISFREKNDSVEEEDNKRMSMNIEGGWELYIESQSFD